MTKEDFQERYGRYSIAEAVKEKPYDSNLRTGLEAIVKEDKPELGKTTGIPADQVHAIAGDLSKDYQTKLVEYVSGNIDNLVNDITNKDNALALILGLKSNLDSDEAKLVREIQENRELLQNAEKDPRAVLAMVQELVKYDANGILKNALAYIATSSNPQWVLDSFNGLIEVKQRNLATKFSDLAAVKQYVVDNLRAVPEEEKIKTYTGFANMVANTYQAQEAAKQAKKEK